MTTSKETKNNVFPLDNDNVTFNKLSKSPKKITNKNSRRKKYESFIFIPENGNSICSPQYEQYSTIEKGQVFVSETAIEEFVNRIIDQRLGLSKNKEND